MKIRVGDKVELLDENLSGVVKSLVGEDAIVETNAGFDMQFHISELLVVKPSKDFENDGPTTRDVSEKKIEKRKSPISKKGKEKFQPTMEVDLHIHQLTEHSGRMSNHDMLTLQIETARKKLEFAIKNRIQKIVFIHGVDEGVLRMELEYLFGRYDNLKFYDANYQKYGLGATEVYIFQNSN